MRHVVAPPPNLPSLYLLAPPPAPTPCVSSSHVPKQARSIVFLGVVLHVWLFLQLVVFSNVFVRPVTTDP